MDESNKFDILPNEILRDIFSRLSITSGWEETRKAFSQYQLVCHRFSRVARHELYLYKNVFLSNNDINPFLFKLIETSNTSRLGDHVKHLEFDSGVCPRLDDLIAIFERVPNIETIGCSANATLETNFLWKALKESDGQYPHLKLFHQTYSRWDATEINDYKELFLRFKDSLTKLILIPQSDNTSRDIDYCTLKSQIQDSKSLEQLHLDGTYTRASLVGELDKILDTCPRTAHFLKIAKCNLSVDCSYYSKENPNNTIRSLEVVDSKLLASTMKYLKNKFAALETLMFSTNAKNPFEAQTEEDYAEWWNQMAHLCQKPLQSYNINISEFKTQDYLYHIQGSVKLFDAIAPGPKKLTIDITSPFDDEDDDKMIPLVEMKQSKSRVGLFDSRDSEKFLQNVDFVRLYERLQPFSPNIIRVLNNGSFESHSWEILSCIIALIGNKAKSVAHFHGMVFANPVDAALMQQKGGYEETSVATLKFSNCKIYADVFSKLSPQLSKVDTMIIDNCDIPASSLNQLEINLAATQLCRLELKLKGIGCSTIIVTTDTSEQTYYQHDEIKDNSFIYIRCKELQSLIISGKKMF